MRIVLENEKLKAEIESFGVELKSLVMKSTGQEYMWEADAAYWGKTSPILFPFIGKLAGEQYRYKGKVYPAEKHGFARDMEFRVVSRGQDKVVFVLESTVETLQKYPFPFSLEVTYTLEDNVLSQQWSVQNKGTETMYFSMGGHPAFAAPLMQNGDRDGKRTECFVKLYGVEDRKAIFSTEIDVAVGLTSGNQFPVEIEQGVFPIVDHIFDKDALVFAGEGVTAVGLLDKNGDEYIRLEAPTCPVWGVWSMPTGDASYVCFEPWWGCCDERGYEGTLAERPYTNSVEIGQILTDGYRIVVGADYRLSKKDLAGQIVCNSCGASFDASLPKCPYCDSTSYPGAEAEYLDKLEDVREDVEELKEVPQEETKKVVKSQVGFVVKILLVVAAVAVAILAWILWVDSRYQRDEKADYLWRQQNYPKMDEMYANGQYEELLEFYLQAELADFDVYQWEHTDFCNTYLDLEYVLMLFDDEKAGVPLNEADLAEILYCQFSVIKGSYFFNEMDEEEKQLLAEYITSVEQDFDSRWQMTEEELAYFDKVWEKNDGFIPYDECEKFVKKRLDE